MTLALAALVLCSLSPSSLVSSASLGQGKVQIIKGKRGTGTVKAGSTETVAPTTADSGAARAADLERKSAELDAKNKDLAQREQALQEKEAAAGENEKKKSDQQKAQLKHIEKIGEQNQRMIQGASDSLAGD